jgi:uncharacterized protein YndB with AHSA1/START domain
MSKSNIVADPGTYEIRMSRTYEAPRDLVFKVSMDPELVPQWWGPAYLTTTVDKMDVRPGGQWRFVQLDPDGNEYAFHGVYHDIEAPARFVQTFEWEGMPGHVILETYTFDEVDGKTTVTTQSIFQSVADRDGMLASGMEEGSVELMDRLGALLAKLVAA